MRYVIENGTVSLGGRTVLDHIHFSIKGREKVAIVGRNGAGKTTLLRLIAGELTLDRDDKIFGKQILKEGHFTVGYLRQGSFSDTERTVEEELLSLFAADDLYSRERFSFEQECDRILTGFGFAKADKKKKIREFSGGEQTKLAFVRLLLEKPDLLLLDEPTNHLDIASVEWLESYLATYERAVILVSHDRFFLDRTTEIVYELSAGKLTRYVGNYTAYREQKRKNRAIHKKKYEAQQAEIARLTALIERFKHKPKKASMARTKKKLLERMELLKKPDDEEAHLFTEPLPPLVPGEKLVFSSEELKIGYDKPLQELTLRIRRGQKIAILGANGAGKTTFLKTITGQIAPLGGRFRFGEHIEVGYFDQHTAEITSQKRVGEHFGACFPKLTEKEKRKVLGRYLFSGDLFGKPICLLSGGEKSRLFLAELLESRPNLLLLDEPTNHMDLPAKETLESAFLAYTGTMLFISHDRYFVSQVADALLLFGEEGVSYYPFGYEHYIYRQKKKREEGQSLSEAVRAENAALVDALLSVPDRERHQTPRLSTEQAYADWQFSLAAEQLAACREALEAHSEGNAPCTLESWMSGEWEREQERLLLEYDEKCLLWYERWQEYGEAFFLC